MKSKVVDKNWGVEIEEALRLDASELLIISPFLKLSAVVRLLAYRPHTIRVLTRFNLCDFAAGVSDISAIRELVDSGAAVRGVRNLHAKLYVFGMSQAFITSANLTVAGLDRNHEFGVATKERELVMACRDYFDTVWKHARKNVEISRLSSWESKICLYQMSGGCIPEFDRRMDEGVDIGLPESEVDQASLNFVDRPQAFVKFLGQGHDRAPLSNTTLSEVDGSGCHWALPYPKNRRPRSVNDGAVMFISRLVDDGDIRIYGRAIGLAYVQGRDDATDTDILVRDWKSHWPHYIRVHDAEFVDGTLENGVSLANLMDELGASCFATTARHAAIREGNTNPRLAIRRHPAVELSSAGAAWLTQQLEASFDTYGKISRANLRNLDWPVMPEIIF